ncbi:hypothetical protein KR044_010182 [Drosophila immigrans]|nr:hypothetical protein KR044_010182 [Drosophila immigrans]
MWYNKFNWTIFVFLVLFTLVTGSCLEYGHSCWGAHGKRSGNRPPIAAKQAPPYVDNLAEQLLGNNNINNNNGNAIDDESNNNSINNNNKLNDLPLTASALSLPSERGVAGGDGSTLRDVNDAKWTQLLRQRRYQLRQLQRQFDATDAADSWRKLQQAMQAEAEQQQQQQRQRQLEQQQQQQQLPIGDFFELSK